MNRTNIRQFLIWLRNGTSFAMLWFLILLLIRNYALGIETFTTFFLLKLLVIVFGGVLLFSFCFFPACLKRRRFQGRLTLFMVTFSIYECFAFRWLGLWTGVGKLLQYVAFAAVVLVMYLICLAIFERYSKKKGELYTKALEAYKKKLDEM